MDAKAPKLTKWTPGPWAVAGISQNTGSISVGQKDLRIVIADVTNAASFADMLSGAMKRGGGNFRQSDATTQFANAHLIAAAPAMAEALQQIVDMNVQYAIDRYGDASQADSMACVTVARRALSLAKGEQP